MINLLPPGHGYMGGIWVSRILRLDPVTPELKTFLLDSIGIPRQGGLASGYVPETSEDVTLQVISLAEKDALFPAKAALRVPMEHPCLLCRLLCTAPTVSQGLSAVTRFFAIERGSETLLSSDSSSSVSYLYLPHARRPVLPRMFYSTLLLRALRSATDFAQLPLRILTANASSRIASGWSDLISAPVAFSPGRDGFEILPEHLSLPVKSSNPELHALLLSAAERLMQNLEGSKIPVSVSVGRVICAALREGDYPSQSEVADQLNMSSRTLQRRLKAEGTSLSVLSERSRLQYAVTLLADFELPLSEISLRLGFSEQPAFSAAFRSWTGRTPDSVRRNILTL